MSEKSVLKKKLIVDTAKKIFIRKGFKAVSMKDIVEACDISRGGLYLYFSDTEEIFLEVLRQEAEAAEDILSSADDASAAFDVLAAFMKAQKKEILRIRKTLAVAKLEYFSSHKGSLLQQQFDADVMHLAQLIDLGVAGEVFAPVDSQAAAENIMYVLEGLRTIALTGRVSEETIDKELMILMQGLIIEE
ncbi:MAG: TetR/AcrR family transcriptional regulator [Lachnospiraceae bacterium]|nr:TetR/AcrR family transcriptional regulator [Lachnospiraceae bacterium]